MRKRRLITMAAVLAYAAIARGQSVPPATQSAGIDTSLDATTQPADTSQLLVQLSSERWAEREAAQEKLVQMGEEARPIIAVLLAQTQDNEARARLTTALERIDANRVTGASTITLHMKDASPRQVFAELSRQCFAPLRPFPDNLWEQEKWPAVTIDIDRQPFWAAMGQIAEKTGVDLQQYSDGIRLMRGGNFRASGPSVVRGPFLIVATQISRSQTISLGSGAAQSDFSVQLVVYCEPKLHVLSATSAMKVEEAVDDRSNSLLPDALEGRDYFGGGGSAWNLSAQLKYPQQPGTRIARLRGSTTLTLQTESQTLEIPDLLAAHELSRSINGLPVVIHELKKAGTAYELRVSIARDVNDMRWAELQQSVYQRLKVYDRAGQTFEYRGMSSRGSNVGVEFTLTLSPAGQADGRPAAEPSKLVWEVPTASKTVPVMFEFADLPMPK